jgi:hypothetical protein
VISDPSPAAKPPAMRNGIVDASAGGGASLDPRFHSRWHQPRQIARVRKKREHQLNREGNPLPGFEALTHLFQDAHKGSRVFRDAGGAMTARQSLLRSRPTLGEDSCGNSVNRGEEQSRLHELHHLTDSRPQSSPSPFRLSAALLDQVDKLMAFHAASG